MKTHSNPPPLPGDYALDDNTLADQLAKIGLQIDNAKRERGQPLLTGDEISIIFYRGELERVIKALRRSAVPL